MGSDGLEPSELSDLPVSEVELVRLVARRTIHAPIDAVWNLWGTASGLESWWAPEGTTLRVERLEFRPGGRIEFEYLPTAALENPAWGSALESQGHSSRWTARGMFSEVRAKQALSFVQDLEFGRGGREIPYAIRAKFEPRPNGTVVTLTARSLRTKHWALLGRGNLVGQLARLAATAERSVGSISAREPPGPGTFERTVPRSGITQPSERARSRRAGARGRAGPPRGAPRARAGSRRSRASPR